MRPEFAGLIASPERRISFSLARAKEQIVESLIARAIALIASKSPGEAAAPILAAYRDAIGRAASPREISSLCENIAFLLDLWSPRDKVTIRILEQLKESLQ